MRRHVMPGLVALVASTIYVQASTPAPPQPFRKLEYSRIGPWEVAAIGNDEKVNHCALARGTASPDPKQGEPKFLLLVDKETMILRLRAAEYKFTGKKALAVTAITAEGVESKPLAATGGPDLADVRFSAEPTERDALLSTKHLDIRTGDATVRLSFEGLDEAQPAFKQCLANIGSPAKGWSDAEFEHHLVVVQRLGKTRCARPVGCAKHHAMASYAAFAIKTITEISNAESVLFDHGAQSRLAHACAAREPHVEVIVDLSGHACFDQAE